HPLRSRRRSIFTSPLFLYSTSLCPPFFICFFFNDPATTEIYTLSLHDALPILWFDGASRECPVWERERLPERAELTGPAIVEERSEEHTSELQSPCNLVCRLLLEKKKKKKRITTEEQL